MNKLANLRLLALVAALALALFAVACGDDDEDESGGSAGTTTQEETMAESQPLELNGEMTTLVLDAGTAKVLTDNKVKVAPVDPAAPDGDGIGFPITGGTVDSESLAGTIDHSGGLRFSAGGTDLEVTDFVVDTEAGTLTATAGGAEIPLLSLDLSGLQRSMDGRCHRRVRHHRGAHRRRRQGAQRHVQGQAVRRGPGHRRRDGHRHGRFLDGEQAARASAYLL